MAFNSLYKWFVGLNQDDAVWDASVFCKNRDRLLQADVSVKLLQAVIAHPGGEPGLGVQRQFCCKMADGVSA